jgi:hypothetical protein
VVKKFGVNLSSVNRFRMEDLPTPESPSMSSLTLFLALMEPDYILLFIYISLGLDIRSGDLKLLS